MSLAAYARLPLLAASELLLLALALLLAPLPAPLRRRLPLPRRLLRTRRDHFAPHPSAQFEGYYARVLLDESDGGGTVVVILCTVRGRPEGDRPGYAHFSYLPAPGLGQGQGKISVDMFPPEISEELLAPPPPAWPCANDDATAESETQPFALRAAAPYQAELTVLPASQAYYFALPGGLYARVKLTDRQPLDGQDALRTPEGKWVGLGEALPLHWHVLSVGSRAEVEIWRTGMGGGEEEGGVGREQVGRVLRATGVAHVEKNWGQTFPRGWAWSQAFSPTGSFSLAGGHILGQKAYLVVYRSTASGLRWDFAPPWTVMLFGRGATIRERVERAKEREGLELEVCDWGRRLVVRVRATESRDTWLPLHCPLADGHRPFASETFTAVATVDAYVRDTDAAAGWSVPGVGLRGTKWKWVESQRFEDVAFELGGDYR